MHFCTFFSAFHIYNHLDFSGPPDPLHGDAPYVKVREAAGVWNPFLIV